MKIRPLERTYRESGTEDENGAKRIGAGFRAALRGIEMDSDELHLRTGVDPDEGLVIEVEGYLDGAGGDELTREAAVALAAGCRHVRIDLEHVVLFNCSGARRLLAALRKLEEQGLHVELVHVRAPLRRALEFTA